MRLFVTLITLTTLIVIPASKSADRKEIKRFCKRTLNYEKCLEEFESVNNQIFYQNNDKAIEIEVIPYVD